jgi:hypothetical protein
MRAVLLSLVIFSGCADESAYKPAGTGPAASLVCPSSGKNAYDTYGTTAFVTVNEAIFTNVTAEINAHMTANLGNSFSLVGGGVPTATTDDISGFKGNLGAFLIYVYGGPTSITYTDGKMYNGVQDMKTAHTGLGITSSQYDYFVANIVVPALTSSGVVMDDVSTCFAPPITSADFKATIVGQ